MINKVVASAAEAVADIPDGASLAVGGFGLCGIPVALIDALHEHGTTDLETVSNNCGVDDWGLGVLLQGRPDPPHHQLLRGGEQGVRPAVPRRRAGGGAHPAGHPGREAARRRRRHPRLLHPAGVGTQVSEGGLPQKYDADGGRRDRFRAQGGAQLQRRRLRPGGIADPRLRPGARLEGRPPRQPGLPRHRHELQPAVRHGRAGSPSPRWRSSWSRGSWTRSTSTSRASSSSAWCSRPQARSASKSGPCPGSRHRPPAPQTTEQAGA